ncbi:MAG TPA: zinc ribbon domain-containing protein [Edaphobacter sp.]|nr:zinc ribbon domain-containing protein [Edaphobacter sp.]
MHEFCHRCGGELVSGDGGSTFCPHCGAPQIYLSEAAEADAAATEVSTGVLPPPQPQLVEWKTAILCAILVALIGAALSAVSTKVPAFSFINWLWTVSASVVALGIYQRRRPQARMDAVVGARIGILVGLTLIAAVAVTMASAGLVARYSLHSMGSFDAELRAQIDKAAAANPQPAEVMRYIYSPEFRAGIMLAGFSMLAGLIMVLSTLGGAVSGLLRTRRS